MRLFRIILNDDFTIKRISFKDVAVKIPSFPAFTYVASLESVSMDDEGGIYVVDDPWKQFFIPPHEILKKLDNPAVANFSGYVPIIYKFNSDESILKEN